MLMTVSKRKSSAGFVREPAAVYGEDGVGSAVNRTISAGEFRARCLAIVDEVRDGRAEYVITKLGAPVAKLVPMRTERRPLLGSMTGTVRVLGDIIGPLDEPREALDGPGR
jgi:prevent-host-death family protein